MVFQEKPRQGRAGAQSQGGKKSSPTEEGTRRLRAIRQLCFSPIACIEEFGFVALKRRWSDDQRARRLLSSFVPLSDIGRPSSVAEFRDQLFSSCLSSFQWRQSVPSARILFGLDLIMPTSRSRNE